MRTRHLLLIVLISVAGCAAPRPAEIISAARPESPTFSEAGIASWYGRNHQGKETADGERYDMHAMTAAHRDLPFNTVARVTSEETGQVVKVGINDREDNVKDRVIDLSFAAASVLGMRD